MSESKIGVIGVGGVGGYLAAMLSAHMPGVTVVARGGRGKAVAERGLILHSDHNGEIVGHPAVVASASELPVQDVLFICVKNYSLAQVLEEMAPAVGPETVLVPVMNGIDPAERVRQAYPANPVVDSVIYIVSYARPDYEIVQEGDYADLRIGVAPGGDVPADVSAQALRTVEEIMRTAGLDSRTVEDIEAAVWEKFILNCAYNVCTAAYDCNIGPIRDDPERAAEFVGAAREAAALAQARGVKVRPDIASRVEHRFYHKLQDSDSSSLQRDVHAGRPAEIETFCGYVVREARRIGVPVPVMDKMYGLLQERERSARAVQK